MKGNLVNVCSVPNKKSLVLTSQNPNHYDLMKNGLGEDGVPNLTLSGV